MTTIAYNHRDKELASDSQGTSCEVIVPKVYTKIHKLSFGWVGFWGNTADMGAAIKILEGDELEGDWTKLDVGGIVLPDTGSAYNFYIDSLGGLAKEFITNNWAAGSGREFALGAMHVGATAREAVKAAIKYDIYSGGKIVVKKRGDKKC